MLVYPGGEREGEILVSKDKRKEKEERTYIAQNLDRLIQTTEDAGIFEITNGEGSISGLHQTACVEIELELVEVELLVINLVAVTETVLAHSLVERVRTPFKARACASS